MPQGRYGDQPCQRGGSFGGEASGDVHPPMVAHRPIAWGPTVVSASGPARLVDPAAESSLAAEQTCSPLVQPVEDRMHVRLPVDTQLVASLDGRGQAAQHHRHGLRWHVAAGSACLLRPQKQRGECLMQPP